MQKIQSALAMLVLAVGACNSKPEGAPTPSAAVGGMMGGGQMTAQGSQLMAMMGAQLDSLATMTPAQMIAMMSAHEALATQMSGMMSSGMQGMNMQQDAGWMALSDSVKQDLATMPDLAGDSLQVYMMAHIGRIRRMMTMYQGMPHN